MIISCRIAAELSPVLHFFQFPILAPPRQRPAACQAGTHPFGKPPAVRNGFFGAHGLCGSPPLVCRTGNSKGNIRLAGGRILRQFQIQPPVGGYVNGLANSRSHHTVKYSAPAAPGQGAGA